MGVESHRAVMGIDDAV